MRQFDKNPGGIVQFKPYSKYPPCFKDVTFWLPQEKSKDGEPYNVLDLHSLVRDAAGDLVEEVSLIDDFTHPKSGRQSHCYRISYRSMDRTLEDEEVNTIQETVRALISSKLKAEWR